MKLDKLNKRDYPKLQEERVLRKNPQASLHAFGKKLDGDKLAEKYRKAVGGTYVKRERLPNEALPRTGDWRSSVYEPKDSESRVGLARYS
jgi:hypothetical protein